MQDSKLDVYSLESYEINKNNKDIFIIRAYVILNYRGS